MNYIITGVIILIIGYAFGCFSTGYFVERKRTGYPFDRKWKYRYDKRIVRSRWEPKPGQLPFLGDLLKAFIPTLAVKFAFCPAMGYADDITYLFYSFGRDLVSWMGHNFPFYLHFKGGKGNRCVCSSYRSIKPSSGVYWSRSCCFFILVVAVDDMFHWDH